MARITIDADEEILTEVGFYLRTHGVELKKAWHADSQGEKDRRVGKGLCEVVGQLENQGIRCW